MRRFAKSNNIKTVNLNDKNVSIKLDKTTISQYLFSKSDFLHYLMGHNFSQEESERFWLSVYNKNRFTVADKSPSGLSVVKNDFISMRAFVYNYKKFYLEEEQYYKNMFSEAGLRQRMIDLRLTL